MSQQELTTVNLLPDQFGGRRRVLNALSGVVPATVALPFVLSAWSPSWFIAAWVCVYLAVSVLFMTLILRCPSSLVEQAWSIAVALVFCSVPISAVVWSDQPADFWAATTVGVIFIAFEMSVLPFLRVSEWRIGISLVGLTITVCALLTIHPVAALTFGPVVVALISATQRMRLLRDRLARHLQIAENTIRHDALTGLLNRRGLNSAIEDLAGQEITVALIDVDRFKIINDTHGHQVGDEVLMAVAAELLDRLGPQFHLARIGGDEFVAVAPGTASLDAALADPLRVCAMLRGQEGSIECHLSVGVSSGRNVDSAHRLLSEAGFAMRDSKTSDTAVSAFGADLAERLDRTVQVAAIANGDNHSGTFVPVGQVIIDNDRIAGCELLIRWLRPNGEMVSPGNFLPLAAEAGLMPVINDSMVEHAVEFAARFNDRANAPFVAVNISAPHLGAAGFCDRIEALLTSHRVRPERLMIEITETEQLDDYRDWESAATELRALGVSLAVDDFGTGYSSIERLQHLPISHLKFDRSLVQEVSGPFGQIVQGIAGFARAVNIGIIAEGIETVDEHESMRAFGITMFQGYRFHRPEPLDHLEERIIEHQIPAARADRTPAALLG